MADNDPMVEIRNLSKRFSSVAALENINLKVEKGSKVVILGPSGSGKSTLLRCINQLEEQTSGEIWIDGAQVTRDPRRLIALRAEVGMVFQHFNLYPHLTVMENITLAQRVVKGRSKEAAEVKAQEGLKRVGISEKAQAYPAQLSGGQQQRVAIARALAMDPKLMLFDEPTSALDPEMIKEVVDVMLELAAEGITMVVVTHEMGFARAAADEVVFIDKGTIVEKAPAQKFFDSPRESRSQQFLAQIMQR
jgi:ABC-type polar amino acid transport system ATPase subunit